MNKKIYLSVTETSNPCPRKFELEVKYKTGQLDYKPNKISHYYGARGTLIHYVLEQFFKQEPVKWKYWWFVQNEQIRDRIPEWLFDECLSFVQETYNKAIACIQENPELFQNVLSEQRIQYPIDDEFILTGQPDLSSNKYIIDWKSSKYSKANVRKYSKQCSGYDYLLTRNAKPKYRDYVLIFLGGNEARIIIVDKEQRDEATDGFIDNLVESIQLKRQAYLGKHLPCKFSFICSMCHFNNYCRGV